MFQNLENKLVIHCYLSKYYYSIINLWFEKEKPIEKETNEDIRNKLIKHKTNIPIFIKIKVNLKIEKKIIKNDFRKI